MVTGMLWSNAMPRTPLSTRSPKLEGDNAKIDAITEIAATNKRMRTVLLLHM
jgi:hypothetical protein